MATPSVAPGREHQGYAGGSQPVPHEAAAGGKILLATLAGVGSLCWSGLMFLLVLFQLGVAAEQSSGEFAALGLWNGLIAFGYIIIGIGILSRKRWSWDWGIGTNTLNMLFGLYQLTQGVWVNLLFLPIELFILVTLYATKSMAQGKSNRHTAGAS